MTRDLGLSIDKRELDAALANATRGYVRKRLLAIRAILAGKSIRQAQAIAGVGRSSVDRWLRTCRDGGLHALLLERRGGRRLKRHMSPAEIEAARQEVAAVLARPEPPPPRLRARLIALDMLLSGRPIEEAAATASVRPDTATSWVRHVIRDGITPTLEKWTSTPPSRALKVNADPTALRELAAREPDPRVRKRLLALALVAEGMSALDASVCMGMSHSTLLSRVKRFQQEGLAAVQDRSSRGSGKLTDAQLDELGRFVLDHPDITYPDLSEHIRACYRASYSVSGLKRLLRQDLGIDWRPRPRRDWRKKVDPDRTLVHHRRLSKTLSPPENPSTAKTKPHAPRGKPAGMW